MRIDGYEVNNGHVIAVFITDKKRNMKQHKYEPARPHGEWIDLSDGWQEGTFRCSSCQMEFVLIEGTPEDNEYNFCPNCGSDNRKRGDEEC